MNNKHNEKILTQDEWIKLFLGTTFLFGMIARFFPGVQAGFPLNDGGMFLNMIRDLRTSHYALPIFTSYNSLNIPYAYPPFGFYFARLLSDIFNLSDISLLRWLPPAINTLSILAFYKLASLLLESNRRGVVATVFYALTPGAFAWFIMGGGLTRSFGSLFMLLSLYWIYRLYRDGRRSDLILSVLFCSLTILSHPEVGLHAAAAAILLWFCYGRTTRTALYSVIIAIATILISSPWWGSVLMYHGVAPFLSAMNTGYHNNLTLGALFSAIIESQSTFQFLIILRVAGIFWGLSQRRYFLLLWFLLPYLVEPRSAPSIVFYPLCMLMAYAVADALPAVVDYFRNSSYPLSPKIGFTDRRWVNIVLILVMIYLFIESSLFGFKLINTSLKEADQVAMTWIQQNTPLDSHFLPITGQQSPEIDPFVEWFPALTGRRSQSTIQGQEWLLRAGFYMRYADLAEVQICKTINCIAIWSDRTGLDYDYIVIRNSDGKKELVYSLSNSENYVLVYSIDDVVVYSKQNP